MKYHHLYSDASGESHWRDVEIPLEERIFAPPAANILVSQPVKAVSLVFLRLKSGWNKPAHPTPLRQTLICTAGSVRVTASDGEARDITLGSVWRMEDTTGKGHHTCVTSEEDFEAVAVQSD